MRRLFVPREQLAAAGGGLLALTPEQDRYLARVLRLSEGEQVEVFDGLGEVWDGVLVEEPGARFLRLAGPRGAAAKAGAVLLAQALCKGEKLELVVQKATELGVDRVVPFAAERSVVKLSSERGASRAGRLRRVAQEAARQCGRASVPEIDEPRSFDELLALPEARGGLLLDTDPGASPLGQLPLPERVLLAVGPEGGFSPAERERARAAGLQPASLGRRVLRTETCGLVAVALVQHLRGELG